MSVHPSKSKAMIIRKTPFIGPLSSIYFGNDIISFTTNVDCLGLTIDNQLSWSIQINHVCKSYSKKVSALKCMKYLPQKVLEELYYKTVIPAVAYTGKIVQHYYSKTKKKFMQGLQVQYTICPAKHQ